MKMIRIYSAMEGVLLEMSCIFSHLRKNHEKPCPSFVRGFNAMILAHSILT